MKKCVSIIMTVVIMVVSLCGCSIERYFYNDSNSENAEVKLDAEYSSKENGISLKYPSDWTIDEDNPDYEFSINDVTTKSFCGTPSAQVDFIITLGDGDGSIDMNLHQCYYNVKNDTYCFTIGYTLNNKAYYERVFDKVIKTVQLNIDEM